MILETWLPIYERIVKQLGLDSSKDRVSCEWLSKKIDHPADFSLFEIFRNRDTIVIGNSPSLEQELDSIEDGVRIVAGSALNTYYQRFGCPDIIVTDLDHDFGVTDICLKKGSIVFIHAHGDNIQLIESLRIPVGAKIVGTCQCSPVENTINLGGFTDGDRAVYIADFLGSPRISLIGFDFQRIDVNVANPALKLNKLKIAEELLRLLYFERIKRYGNRNIIFP